MVENRNFGNVNEETESEKIPDVREEAELDVSASAGADAGEFLITAKDINKIKDEITKQKAEYDALYDKYLRTIAEFDNYRKRTLKEKESIYSDAVADVMKTILPVYDNIERAVAFSEPEKVFDGLKMIMKQAGDSLTSLGIVEIKALDGEFNPELHNAVFHEQDDSDEVNKVTEVLQKGYVKGDKVIRPSMVKVKN